MSFEVAPGVTELYLFSSHNSEATSSRSLSDMAATRYVYAVCTLIVGISMGGGHSVQLVLCFDFHVIFLSRCAATIDVILISTK